MWGIRTIWRNMLAWPVLATGLFAAMLPMTCGQAAIQGGRIFINEFHYDNRGRDRNEFVEVVIPDLYDNPLDLGRLRFSLYNGSNGRAYAGPISLADFTKRSGASRDGANFYYFDRFSTIQNGAPDGFALAYDSDGDATFDEVQFLSYEGRFVGTAGDARGLTSIDVGVFESSSTSVGLSLQLGGAGRVAADFTWRAPQADTKGGLNRGQTFASSRAVPEPAGIAVWALLIGLAASWQVRYRWPPMRST